MWEDEEVEATYDAMTPESATLRAENATLRAESATLRAKSAKLRAESAKLRWHIRVGRGTRTHHAAPLTRPRHHPLCACPNQNPLAKVNRECSKPPPMHRSIPPVDPAVCAKISREEIFTRYAAATFKPRIANFAKKLGGHLQRTKLTYNGELIWPEHKAVLIGLGNEDILEFARL
ncbi:hypothetical protein T492DRAFT_1145321 [Pavlovales sp. CCMP2436]|nr:hypothetical protein T492DRAFT_1145321 [Pavlovales sp. CCMP2436]